MKTVEDLEVAVDFIMYIDPYDGGAVENASRRAENCERLLRHLIASLPTAFKEALCRELDK